MAYEVGDRLIWRQTQGRPNDSEVEVVKVGRKWGEARPVGSAFGGVKFDLETGYEDSGQYMSRSRVLSQEQADAESRRAAVCEQLRALGVSLERRWYPTDALERVVSILAAAS